MRLFDSNEKQKFLNRSASGALTLPALLALYLYEKMILSGKFIHKKCKK